MKKLFKKKLRPFYRFSKFILKVNLLKTMYINFKTQSFKNAIKLPIVVYGKLSIYSLRGSIIIDGPITTGMIQLGKDIDHNPISFCPIKLTVDGTLRFKGHAVISGGSTITVWEGEVELGKFVSIGSGVQLKSVSAIWVGEYSRIVALCTIMDTNVHYVKNILSGEISRSFSPIKIGNNCWINQGTVVAKGTVIPDYCITARNSFLNKNYSNLCSSHSLLAGTPAKVIATNTQRIFDFEKETQLNIFF
ncbi:hypothetical protein [Photobacterium leiognathi]